MSWVMIIAFVTLIGMQLLMYARFEDLRYRSLMLRDQYVYVHGMVHTLGNKLDDLEDAVSRFEFNDKREKEVLANSILDLRDFVNFDPYEDGYKNYEEGESMNKLKEKQQ